MQNAVDLGHLNGIQILLARRGQPFHFKSFGWQDKDKSIPLVDNTIFRIFSMTKPIVSVAAMMLFEQGLLQLTDPVSDYLPGFHNLKVYIDKNTCQNLERPVNIRDLLTHTSGLSYGFDESSPVDQMYREADLLDRQISGAEMLERLCRIPLVSQPGTRWRYSIATDVVGLVVAELTGKSLGESLSEMIFEPLGMPDTAFQVPTDNLNRLSVNYRTGPHGVLEPMPSPESDPVVKGVAMESGGGGLVGTTADYCRFTQMLLNEGTLDNVRILGPRTIRYMASNHLQPGQSPFGTVHSDYTAYGFGLGYRVLISPGLHMHLSGAGEYGWAGAANTYFWVDPNADLQGIFMSQLLPSDSHDVARLFQSQAYASLED